jgi:hypothetical protein
MEALFKNSFEGFLDARFSTLERYRDIDDHGT